MSRKLPEADAKRHPLSFRTTLAVRERIEADAKANGRSIAQEIEFRLEAGYEVAAARKALERSNAIADALIGDVKTAAMVRSIASSVGAVMTYTGKHWDRDVYTRTAVQACIDAARVGHFREEPLEVEKTADVNLDEAKRCIAIGKTFGRLFAMARSDPAAAEAVEEMARAGSAGAGPDVGSIVADLIERNI